MKLYCSTSNIKPCGGYSSAYTTILINTREYIQNANSLAGQLQNVEFSLELEAEGQVFKVHCEK